MHSTQRFQQTGKANISPMGQLEPSLQSLFGMSAITGALHDFEISDLQFVAALTNLWRMGV